MSSRDEVVESASPNGARGISTVVVVVGGETNPRRPIEILRWIRALVPAALILVSSAPIDLGSRDDVVTVNADDVDAGPLAVAAALTRAPRRGTGAS